MEDFSRFIQLIGEDKFKKIQDLSVLIIGIGGVGGYVVESLARSGVGNLILVDFDTIDVTNKNRQIIALSSTVGRKKVDVFKERILEINSFCQVDTLDIYLSADNRDIFDDRKIDFVVDACDAISSKKVIIEECLLKSIPFISSMGTGNKLDPSQLEILDIRKTSYDPIARILRKWVKDEQIKGSIPVLCSKEKPIVNGNRTPGSTSFVPSSAGLLIGSYIIRDIIKD